MTVTRIDIEGALGVCEEASPVGSQSGSGECWRVTREGVVMACKVVRNMSEPERFPREVVALQRVNSNRVVRVIGHGEMTTSDDGKSYPYLLSEFVPGGDVRENLNSGGPPEDQELRAFLDATLGGLQELHAADVVHRDLKPENIVLRGSVWADPVIIDLGLSRLLDAGSLTIYPWAGGTWPYMAPEQLRAERATDRSDLWALAVVAGELAAGTHPFWQGEGSPPADWDERLQSGISVPGDRPAGFRDLVQHAGHYAAYRRPTATAARELMGRVWP
jgi:eukaryotic-like serine/threonine-protein kinase